MANLRCNAKRRIGSDRISYYAGRSLQNNVNINPEALTTTTKQLATQLAARLQRWLSRAPTLQTSDRSTRDETQKLTMQPEHTTPSSSAVVIILPFEKVRASRFFVDCEAIFRKFPSFKQKQTNNSVKKIGCISDML